MAAASLDANGDGHADLYVANDGGENNTLMWRPNPAVPTLPADETHIAELDTLTLCATVARYELTQHLDIRESPASDFDEIGCFLTDAKDYVPYYRNRTAATAAPSANDAAVCFRGDGDGPGAGFSCVPANMTVGTADVTTYSFSNLTGLTGHPAAAATGVDPADLVAFSCSFPYFPRGEVATRACSTTYEQGETVVSDGTVLVATAVNSAASSSGCADLCTTAGPLCIGYTIEPLVPFTCGLVFPAGTSSTSVGDLTSRVRLKVGYDDSGVNPTGVQLEAVPGRLSYTKKITTRSGNTTASFRDGPWLVYGYADRANLLDQTRLVVDTASRPTPEGCGALCSQIENCVFSVWSDRASRAATMCWTSSAVGLRPSRPTFSDGPSRCGELEINRLDLDNVGAPLNASVRAVCDAAPQCTTTTDGARTACVDLAVSATTDYTAAPVSLPVVYAVRIRRAAAHGRVRPVLVVLGRGNLYCLCRSHRDGGVRCGRSVTVPANVSDFTATAFSRESPGGGGDDADATPRSGAFSGACWSGSCLRTTSATDAGAGCSVVVDHGAVPSCVDQAMCSLGTRLWLRRSFPSRVATAMRGSPKSSFYAEMPAAGSGYGFGAFTGCRLLHGYDFTSEHAVTVVQPEAFMGARTWQWSTLVPLSTRLVTARSKARPASTGCLADLGSRPSERKRFLAQLCPACSPFQICSRFLAKTRSAAPESPPFTLAPH